MYFELIFLYMVATSEFLSEIGEPLLGFFLNPLDNSQHIISIQAESQARLSRCDASPHWAQDSPSRCFNERHEANSTILTNILVRRAVHKRLDSDGIRIE